MMRYGLVCLLLAAVSWGQAANSTSAPAAQQSATPANPGNPTESKETEAAKVAPDAHVVTINGLCANPPADKTADPNCKTVITRAEFERILDSVQPNMPPRVRRQFAMRYSSALVMAQKAHEMGLDQGPKFDDQMKLSRIQVLTKMFNQSVQEKASQISDKDLEDYYNSKSADYEEADLQRIFVPRSQQPVSKVKLSAAAEKKRQQVSEETMRKEADKLHARAVAGEDFAKLQNEAYTLAALKGKAPSTKMDNVRRVGLPAAQASVMDLKAGEISEVFSDQSGYFIYKVVAKQVEPLDKVKDEIKGTLRTQRVQEQMKAVQQAATPTLDETYFGPEMPPPPHGMPLPPPNANPSPKPSSPGPK